MIEAENNSSLGYITIATTIVALYLGASDTLSNTMRWLMLTLAEYPDVQQKCFEEVQSVFKIDSEITKENCPYLRIGTYLIISPFNLNRIFEGQGQVF